MRLTFEALGWTWHWSLTPTSADDETEFETYQDAGAIGSERITGEHNGWERHPNSYDEPAEGDEGLRIGFGR